MRTALTGAVLKVHGTRHSPNQDDSWRSGHRPTRPTVRPVNAVSPAKSKGFMVPVSPLCHWELPAKPQNPGKSRTPLRESDTEMPTETSGSRRFVRTQRDFHEAHMRTTGGFNGTTEGGPGEVPSLGLRKNGFTTQKGSTNGRVMQMSPCEQQPIPPQQLSPASGQQPPPQGTLQQSSVTVCPPQRVQVRN